MSKELEALEWFGNNAKIHYAFGDIAVDNFKILHQVLKRNEPMKPALDEDSNYRCARCHHIVDNHYCSDCGGAVDWSDENE